MSRPRVIQDLLEQGQVAASRISPGLTQTLLPAFQAGLLGRTRSGGGATIQVQRLLEFEAFLGSVYPQIESVLPRAAGIGAKRNSKTGGKVLDRFVVMARSHHVDEASPFAPYANITRQFGALGIVLDTAAGPLAWPELPIGSTVMTIENQESFLHSEIIPVQGVDLFLRCNTGGRLRSEFIEWLGGQPSIQVLHFGDYDPVGLEEFCRLKAVLDDRVRLFIPDGIEDLFRRFSARHLLEAAGNRSVLARLRRGVSPEMDRILKLLMAYGPLEQEAIFLALATPSAWS